MPLSGNWADEYITDGYVLYDQLLRVWALKSYNYFAKNDSLTTKIEKITAQIEINFTPNSVGEKYHERAYKEVNIKIICLALFLQQDTKPNLMLLPIL